MPKKLKPIPRFAPLQRVTAEPITDPAEQAALLKAHKLHRQKMRRNAKRSKSSAAW